LLLGLKVVERRDAQARRLGT